MTASTTDLGPRPTLLRQQVLLHAASGDHVRARRILHQHARHTRNEAFDAQLVVLAAHIELVAQQAPIAEALLLQGCEDAIETSDKNTLLIALAELYLNIDDLAAAEEILGQISRVPAAKAARAHLKLRQRAWRAARELAEDTDRVSDAIRHRLLAADIVAASALSEPARPVSNSNATGVAYALLALAPGVDARIMVASINAFRSSEPTLRPSTAAKLAAALAELGERIQFPLLRVNACEWLAQSLTEAEDWPNVVEAYLALGAALGAANQDPSAAFERAMSLARAEGLNEHLVHACRNAALHAAETGHFDHARTLIQSATTALAGTQSNSKQRSAALSRFTFRAAERIESLAEAHTRHV